MGIKKLLAKLNFAKVKHDKMVANLMDVASHPDMADRLTTLQNEVGVDFSTKVIAITSIRDDVLAAGLAKGLADTFANNGEKTLIIDANLYNPCLKGLLGDKAKEGELSILGDNVSTLCLGKEVYPSEVYKSGKIHEIIEKYQEEYAHFVVLVPTIRDHKEIVLLRDDVTAILLVAQKNVTIKQSIYEAAGYCVDNSLPFAKTVVLK